MFILSLLLSLNTVFAVDPRLNYQVLETPHFDIVHDARQKQLAKKYAVAAEESYQILEPYFGEMPTKTVLVVDDSTDITNGFALSVPRPTIYGFPVFPAAGSTLDNYGVWSKDLTIHEYTHILNMEPAHGVWSPFRFLFGSIIRPNMLLPRWYLEGLAVEVESRFTAFGRLRSNDYMAMIRSEIQDGVWGKETISRINEVSIPTWPRGQRPYYYGALLWHYLVQEKSTDIIKKWNQRYSRRIPYFINGPAKDDFGTHWQGVLNQAYEKYGKMGEDQIATIKNSGTVTEGAPIETKNAINSFVPTISLDGTKLIFVSSMDTGDTSIQISERTHGEDFLKSQQLLATTDTTRAVWTADSSQIVFDKTDTFKRMYTFYDLYLYDLKSKKEKQITKGLRAFNPAVSPKSDRIIFVQNNDGETQLAQISMDGKNFKTIYIPYTGHRVSFPEFLSSTEVIFSERTLEGQNLLKVLNLETGRARTVLPQYSKSQFPIKTENGVLFINENSGVQNLYLADSNLTNAKALTNSVTAVATGTLDRSRNKIYYSHLKSKGYRLERIEIPVATIGTPKVENELAAEFPNVTPSESKPFKVKTKNYSGWRYMVPQYWLPNIFILSDGFTAGASVSSSDPLSLQGLILSADYDSRSKKTSFSGEYLHSTSIGTFDLLGYYFNLYSAGFDNTSLKTGAQLTYMSFIPGLSNKWKWQVGWDYNTVDDPLLVNDYTFHGPTVGILYDNTSEKGYQISPTGTKAQLQYTHYLPNASGTDFDTILFGGTYYLTKWLPDNHAFMFREQAYYTPANRSILLGTATIDSAPIIEVGSPMFTMRGYPSGEFIGWQAFMGTAEYRLPIAYPYSGTGTFPLFFQKLSLSIFADALSVNGAYFDTTGTAIREKQKYAFMDYGAEFVFHSTVFYHVPMKFKFGYAYGASKIANGGSNIYMTLGL